MIHVQHVTRLPLRVHVFSVPRARFPCRVLMLRRATSRLPEHVAFITMLLVHPAIRVAVPGKYRTKLFRVRVYMVKNMSMDWNGMCRGRRRQVLQRREHGQETR